MSIFAGILSKDWKTLKSTNQFGFKYIPIKWYYNFKSRSNDRYHQIEQEKYGDRIDSTEIPLDPIFILGHWRSGTTMLHNTICQDEQFAFPNLLEAYNPHTFLYLEDRIHHKLQTMEDKKRPMDNVQVNYDSPAEDEFALALLSLCSPLLGWTFPRQRDYYDRYLFLDNISDDELKRWYWGVEHFVKKLTFKYGKRLVLKSPQHTARIKHILKLFPNAKFIHFRRNPYKVFQSTMGLHEKTIKAMALQPNGVLDVETYVINTYRDMYSRMFNEQSLIPKQNYCELNFENFVTDPVQGLQAIYQSLEFELSEEFLIKIKNKQSAEKKYARNTYPPLAEETKQRINREWEEFFYTWNYRFQ